MKLYVTVPPPVFDAVAVKVTLVPAQTVVPGAGEMLTAGVTLALIDIIMLFEEAVVEVRQLLPPAILISTVTWSPLARVLELYVLEAPICTDEPLTLKL